MPWLLPLPMAAPCSCTVVVSVVAASITCVALCSLTHDPFHDAVTATGATSDMFAMAPAGFPDATPAEMTNVALRTTTAESSTAGYWGDAGSSIAVDGRDDKTNFCCANPPAAPNPPFGCTHTNDGRTSECLVACLQS